MAIQVSISRVRLTLALGVRDTSAAAAAITAHTAAADPHPMYALEADLGTSATYDVGELVDEVAAGLGLDGYVAKGVGWAVGPAFALVDSAGALQPMFGSGLSIPVINFSDGSTEAWPVTGWAATLLDDASAAAGRATLELGTAATRNVGAVAGTVCAGDDARLSDARAPTSHTHAQYAIAADLGELATMDLADLPGGSGIAAGAAWSPVAAGALTVDAWSAVADPTLAVAGDVVSCSGIGGFVAASGAIPALLDLRLDDLSGVAVGYGVGAAVGIPDGSSSVWAVIGVFRETSSLWRLMLVSRTVPHYIFGWWTEIGGTGSPFPDLAAPPLRIRWDHGAGCLRVQLADSSWLSYGPVDQMPALAPRETQSAPTAWGVGLVRFVDATAAACSATVRLLSGADDGDIAWIGGDAGDELSRQPVPAVLSVLARASGGASRSIPFGGVGAEIAGAETQAAGRTSLGLAAIASSGSASDLGSGQVPTDRIASGASNGKVVGYVDGAQVWRQAPQGGVVLRRGDSRLHPVPLPATGLALSTGSMTANTIRAVPLLSASQAVLEAVGVEVTTLNAGAVIGLAVYADDGTGYPGALIQDLGTVSPATIGVKIVTGLSIPVPAGVPLWVAFNTNSTTTCRALALGGHPALLGMPAGGGTAIGIAYTSALSYASGFPATFPAGAAAATAIAATPLVRFSS